MSEHIEMDGVVIDVGRGAFRVECDGSEHVIIARVGGKLRKNKIRIIMGDKVRVKMSPYDLTNGIITRRY